MGGSADKAPNSVERRDVSVLVGMLAELETTIMAGEMPEHLTRQLARRFVKVGLLNDAVGSRDLRQAINDLNHRLRYVNGEYHEPIEPIPVPE
jgi:hypothetical protein